MRLRTLPTYSPPIPRAMLKGVYLDELTDSGGVRWSSGWRSNAIVESCGRLLASLLKREEGIEGILYWAVGSGEAGWDAARPAASPATSRLRTEVVRLALSPDRIRFIDAAGRPSEAPTDRLEVTVELSGDELAPGGFLPLREFGLFGGNASDEADTGLLIDYVAHPRIDLSRGFVLRRTLRLSFAVAGGTGRPGDVNGQAPGGFGAGLPVGEVDGVGEIFGAALAARGIATIGDLARIDPRAPAAGIPPVNLLEIRTKARMVLDLRLEAAPFQALSQRTLSGLLLSRPRELAAAAGGEVTPESAARLQDALALLQIALDEESLKRLTLGDLLRA